MKKIFSLIAILALAINASAQLDRSVRPEPGPAPELNFGKYKVYELDNGLKVIVVEDHKLPRISMNLIVDRDPVLEGKKAGYVELAGEMLRQGTTSRAKEKLDEEIDFIGASLSTSSNSVYTSGLSKYSEKLVELMADVALHPAFPADEFDKLKKQYISGLQSQKEEPDAVASNVFQAQLYGKDHPYGEVTTEETVNNVDLDDCKQYYNNYWVPNNTYIAIVGDIKAKAAKKLVEKYFKDWKEGNIARNVFEKPAPAQGLDIAFVNKDAAVQSVIDLGNIIELKPGDPDIVKLQLANQILGVGSLGRLFQNIREDKAYTYGAYSSYDEDRLIGHFSANASVRNEVTDSAIVEFIKEFKRLRDEPATPEEIEGAKNYIIGSFGRALERPQTVATFALNIQRYNLPDDYYETYLQKLQNVTAEDIMAVAKKYITPDNMHLVVVGKASDVADKLKKFGTVNYYDEYGNKTTAPSMPVPAGLTTDSVIHTYIRAIGGKENLNKVKDVQMKMDVAIPNAPMKVTATSMQKRPNKYKMELVAAGMGTLQKMVFNGEKGSYSGMQGAGDLEGEQLEDMKRTAQFNPELQYLTSDYKLKLTKMAKVDDEKAYVMEVTDPSGKVTTEYYSATTGLKLKEESTEEGQQGPVVNSSTYSDYREVNGVKYPYSIDINNGGQKIKMTVTDIQVNKGIKDSEFQK